MGNLSEPPTPIAARQQAASFPRYVGGQRNRPFGIKEAGLDGHVMRESKLEEIAVKIVPIKK